MGLDDSPTTRFAGRCRLTALLSLLLVAQACSVPDSTLRIVAYNIRHGAGTDNRVDLDRTAAVIRALDPDVVTLQEVDRGARRTDGVDQTARLAALTGMPHHAFGAFMDYQGGAYGMAILSKHPLRAITNHRLPDGAEPRTALAATVTAPGAPDVTVVGIHLYRTETERLAQAEALIGALQTAAKNSGTTSPPITILAGDFNSKIGDPVLRRLEQEFYRVAKSGPGNTFPAGDPDREIDFFFVHPLRRFAMGRCVVATEAVASDHRPIVLDVKLRD